MNPQLRMYLIDKAIEIIREKKKKLTAKNIANEFYKIVKLMDIPLVEEEEIIREITTTTTFEPNA